MLLYFCTDGLSKSQCFSHSENNVAVWTQKKKNKWLLMDIMFLGVRISVFFPLFLGGGGGDGFGFFSHGNA